MKQLPQVPVIPEFIAFNGGLDTVTPPLSMPPGFLREAQNFEQDINGGYSRVMGYERCDGRSSPSEQTYSVLICTITGSVSVGDILTDDAGTSYGTVIALPTGQAILTKVTGAWGTPGDIKVGVTVVGTFVDPPVVDGGSTTELRAQYANLAADEYRSDIHKVGENTVTITIATPAVISWTGHGLQLDDEVVFTTDGALPTGITASTTYYVISAGLAADSFRISASAGGAAVNTSGSQSGTHTCSAGSGAVRGAVLYGDVKYAFRNNVSGTFGLMWRTSATGWQKIPLYREIEFTAGSGSVAATQTLTETTGGETATIMAVVVTSGALADGDAAGRLIISAASAAFEGGASTTSGGGTLTTSGPDTAITIAASGNYEFEITSFTGSGTKKLYGCNGVSRAFEYDGSVFIPIHTGMTTDTPSHIVVHKRQLFLSFLSSVQHCAPGSPHVWDAIVGAAELGMGDDVTAFKVKSGGQAEAALAIFSRNSTAILYGSSVADWNLISLETDTGAIARTVQTIGVTMLLDDRGLTSLESTDVYGNFASNSMSRRVQSWLRTRKSLTVGSCTSGDKNQYRIFFSSGAALYVTLEGKEVAGIMPILLSHIPYCVHSSEASDGSEEIYFGDTTGYLFQMEMGTSFDGASIEYWLSTHFNNSKYPRAKKRYREITFELSGTGFSQFNFTYELGYGSAAVTQPGSVAVDASLSPSYWDAFTWDAFTWDGKDLLPANADLTGRAENISFTVRGNSDYHSSFRISGAIIQYSMGKNLR